MKIIVSVTEKENVLIKNVKEINHIIHLVIVLDVLKNKVNEFLLLF